jgi:hypothetical protein
MAVGEADITYLESEFSFLQVKVTMPLQEQIWQGKVEICEDRNGGRLPRSSWKLWRVRRIHIA